MIAGMLPPPMLIPTPRTLDFDPSESMPMPRALVIAVDAPPGALDDARRIPDWARSPVNISDRAIDGSIPLRFVALCSPSEPERYRLTLAPRGFAIAADTPAPRRHALHTLAQLLRFYAPFARLPLLSIDDAPAIARRGVMLDVSRDKVPTMESLRAAIDLFAHLKINHLQLYTEHTFAYAGHDAVWRDSSLITPSEARELDTYCRARGIELVPNQNTLGHLHRWLNHPNYKHLAEIDGDWIFETDDGRQFPKHGPFSLCPTDPRSIELVRDWLDQLLPCFESSMVNIGLDEAYDVGQGRSRGELSSRATVALHLAKGAGGAKESPKNSPDAAFSHEKGKLFFSWLNQVAAIAAKHHKRTLFWADIALKYPDLLGQLPRGASALIWGYEPDSPFDAHAARLRTSNIPFWTCPGTSSWLSIVGRSSIRRENINAAVRAALEHGAEGVLITNWGDRGHRQHWPIELHSIAYGGSAMWRADNPATFDPRAAAIHLFALPPGAVQPRGAGAVERRFADPRSTTPLPHSTSSPIHPIAPLGPFLESLGDIDAHIRPGLRNTSPLFQELHRPLAPRPEASLPGSGSDWQSIYSSLESHQDQLSALAPHLDPLTHDELEHTLRVALHAARKAVLRRNGTAPREIAEPDRAALAADLRGIIDEHRALWARRNRPGGLQQSAAHYEELLDEYRA